jgi:hypothetical protein
VRTWVALLFALLLVPGLIGFDYWPLTGWRMYSLSTRATRIDWGIEAHTPDGPVEITWPDLPLGYRLAAWPIATLPDAPQEQRQGMCLALLDAVRDAVPTTSSIALVRDRRTLDADDGVTIERERIHECGAA